MQSTGGTTQTAKRLPQMADSDQYEVTHELDAGSAPPGSTPPVEHPERIGRYRVEKVLGQGGFGLVYLAHDEELNRSVAVKVPHANPICQPEDAEAYLAEARTVANLDHPNIVPVHDVGSTEDCPCFVVSKYIEGTDLATRIDEHQARYAEAAELVATVAAALHYAHKQGLVHRDIKPGNILIDASGKPFIVDFGMALREEDIGKGPKYAGTPAYMSPEQARGEGHRVDGRSDIFSLGVVFYELLVGRRPFRGDTQVELLEQITTHEPRPLRQYDDRISKELERICQKAMAKRASDRYSTAKDMSDDLRHFLSTSPHVASDSTLVVADTPDERRARTDTPTATPISDSQPIRIIPKGLRSFDEHDADFFLELLPGPRDRNGLPEIIRFWKTRMEETDPDKTFSVGLIYGPSGCGKSSLIKAGLLPLLSDAVISVYVDSTGEDTEPRLLKGLRKQCPVLGDNLGLKETLAALRRGQVTPHGKKVLVVLDQFEQWLHAKREEENSELVEALRQCDGSRVQCVVMVRDDFWMAATRFMRELEVRLVEGENSGAVDLFPTRHAEKVLAAFGRAFAALPDPSGDASRDQKDFLKQSINGLAVEGKVICVRLALFAEMMKGRSWTPTALREVGGTKGIGVTFLEETFSASTAPPEHRYHQRGARGVLKALLPESGTDIKGNMKSYAELLDASDYAGRVKDFDALIKTLDDELRLITPTDPEGVVDGTVSQVETGQKYYQLTHDYLVPSLRDWLTHKQKETRRGRGELRLAERAALWNDKPENRHLPFWWEYVSIRFLTRKQNWTDPQRRMMIRANRYHGLRVTMMLMLIALISVAGYATYGWFQARALVDTLLTADVGTVLETAEQLANYRPWAEPRLQLLIGANPGTPEDRRQQLHARLALVHYDPSQVEPLRESLLTTNEVAYVGVIRDAIKPNQSELTGECWKLLHEPSQEDAIRFRAALALADYEPTSHQWTEDDYRFLVEQLVPTNPVYQPELWRLMSEVGDRLLDPLEAVFSDTERPESHQIAAANALAFFARHDTQRLAELLTKATPGQYEILYPFFSVAADATSLGNLRSLVTSQPAEELGPRERVSLGRRRAGAAITLLRRGERESIFDVLRVQDDPEGLTQFVHRCRATGITATELVECLDYVDRRRQRLDDERRRLDDPVQYAILLALGEYNLVEVPEPQRQPLVERLLDSYATDPSSGVHSATGWLLRRWGFETEVTRVDQTPTSYDETGSREWFVLGIAATPHDERKASTDENMIYFTFVVFSPADFLMGSPDEEPSRVPRDEQQHRVRLSRPIAISDREITWRQMLPMPEVNKWYNNVRRQQPDWGVHPDHPAVALTWYDAVMYCRWLTMEAGLDQCYADPQSLNEAEIESAGNACLFLKRGPPKDWPLHPGRSGFRLPTEAEWELACRGGMSTSYGFGNDLSLLRHYGWFLDNSDNRTHSVAALRPSLRGLFDVHGNVVEWCHDRFASTLPDESDPLGPVRGAYRAYRGGSWSVVAAKCRSASRSRDVPYYRWNRLGFRVALVPSVSP